MKLEKILYTADVTVSGSRTNGHAKSSDDQLDIKIGSPAELGGSGKNGSNPEQLFGAGYAACFLGAMNVVAQKMRIKLPEGSNINAKVNLGPLGQGFGISAELNVHLPEMELESAQQLVDSAHQVCPYSNATRNNIDVKLNVSV